MCLCQLSHWPRTASFSLVKCSFPQKLATILVLIALADVLWLLSACVLFARIVFFVRLMSRNEKMVPNFELRPHMPSMYLLVCCFLAVTFLCHIAGGRPCLSARLRPSDFRERARLSRFQLSSAKPIIMVTTITLHTNQNMPGAVVFFADFTIQTIILIIAVDARDPSSTVHHLDSLHHHR
ncbi:hypothetical protein Aduo_007035 [Ancylostoma duodenale]